MRMPPTPGAASVWRKCIARLATWCAPPARKVVADAPPFEVIGRKYDFDATVIAATIAGPHPKMNFSPRPEEAADIAAYIATLKQ